MRVIAEVLSLLPDADEFSGADVHRIAYRGHLQLNGLQLQLFDGATSTAITGRLQLCPKDMRLLIALLDGIIGLN